MENYKLSGILKSPSSTRPLNLSLLPNFDGTPPDAYPSVSNEALQQNLQKYNEAVYNSNFDNKVLDTDGRTMTYEELDDMGYYGKFKQWVSGSGNTFGKALRKTTEYNTAEGQFTDDPNNPYRTGEYGPDVKTAQQAREADENFFSDINPFVASPKAKEKVAYPYYDRESGKYYLKLIDGNEKDINALHEQVYNAYGTKPFSSNFLSSFYTGLSNTLGSTKESLLNMTELVGDLAQSDLEYSPAGGFSLKSEEGLTDILASDERIHNRINELGTSYKTDVQPYSSFEGLSSGVGNAVGSIIQYSGFGQMLRGAVGASGLMKSPKGLETMGMLGAGAILNTGEAYTSAKQAGLDDTDAAMLSLATGIINTAVEQKFGSNILNKWLVSGGDKQIPKIILQETGADLSEEGLNKATKGILSRIVQNVDAFTKIPILGTAGEEAFEEGFQTLVNKSSEYWYDQVFAQDKEVGKGKFGTRFNSETFDEIFGSALIGGIAGAAGGVFVNPSTEKTIYPLIAEGRSTEVLEHLNILHSSGKISEPQYEAYKQRVQQLDELWNKNSSVFSHVNTAENSSELKGEILENIETQFKLGREISDKEKLIGKIQGDGTLVQAVKDQKITDVKNDIQGKKDIIDLKNYILKQYLPNEEGKVLAFKKYLNKDQVQKVLGMRFLLEKELKELDDKISLSTPELAAPLIEQREKVLQDLKEVEAAYKKITSAKYQKELKDGAKKQEEEIIKKQEEKQEGTKPESTSDRKPLGTVQKVGSTEEIPFYERKQNSEGFPEYVTERNGKPEILSFLKGWRESSISTPSTGKIVLNHKNHFSDLYTYKKQEEQSYLSEASKERSKERFGDESKASEMQKEIMEENQGSFPALENRALINRILQRPDWSQYLKLIAQEKYTSKPEQELYPVAFENEKLGVRGMRKQGIDILLEVTDPETGEVNTLAHAYNPDHYEIYNGDSWVKLDFTELPYDEFIKRFEFRFGALTPQSYQEFQQNFKDAKEFERKVLNRVIKDGEYDIPTSWYSMSPHGALDFISDYKQEIPLDKIELLKNASIVFMAEGGAVVSKEQLPQGYSLPEFRVNIQQYYAVTQFPNGAVHTVPVYPKSIVKKDDQQEVFSKLNALREEARTLRSTDDNIKEKLKDINSRVPFFIKGVDQYILFVKADTLEGTGEEVSTGVDFKIEFVDPNGKSLRKRFFTDGIDNWEDLKYFINHTDYMEDGIKKFIHVNPSDFRINIPRETIGQENVQKNFVAGTTEKVVKNWSIKFNFNPQSVLTDIPLPPQEEKPKDEPKDSEGDQYDSGLAFKIVDQPPLANQSIDQALAELHKRAPKIFSIEDISTLKEQTKNNGVTIGTVIGSTMYLDSTHAKSTFFHEAFHIVFRNLFSQKKIEAYYRKAKEELGYTEKQLNDAKRSLKAKSPKYDSLTEKELENLVYEEYLADRYAEYMETKPIKSWLRDIFDTIKAWIKFFLGNPDIISMFDTIESGILRYSTPKDNSFGSPANKLIQGLSATETKRIIYTILSTALTNSTSTDKAIADTLAWYNSTLQGNREYLDSLGDQKESIESEMNRVYAALMNPGNAARGIISTIDLLRSEVNKLRKKIKEEALIDEIIDENEDRETLFDIPEFQRKPSDRVGERVKTFLATVPYSDIDPISKREHVQALPWEDMYNRLLVLLNLDVASQEEIIPILEDLALDSKPIAAVLAHLRHKTGYNLDVPSDPNFLQEFKLAFALRTATYGNSVVKGRDINFYIINKSNLGEYKADAWRSSYLLFRDKANSSTVYRNEVLKKIDTLREFIKDNNQASIPLAYQVFEEIGLPLTMKYIKESFGDKTSVLQGKIELITSEDISNIRTKIAKNIDLFEGAQNQQYYLIKKLSNNDTIFDDNLILKTFQDAEGKNRYSYTADSEFLSKSASLKKELIYQGTLDMMREDPYNSLNPLLYEDDAKSTFANYEHILTGSSQRNEDGTSMKNSDEFSYVVMLHTMYNGGSKIGSQEYGYFWLTQIEAKNTQYAVRLPKRVYYKDGQLTPLGLKHALSMVEQEINRLNGVYGKGFKAEGAVYFPFLNDPEFKGKSFNDIKDKLPEVLNSTLRDMIKEHDQYLNEYKLKDFIKHTGDFNEYLGNFIWNDFIGTNSILKLIGGDMAWAKGWEDYVKRNARLIASGPNYGNTFSDIGFFKDEVFYQRKGTWEEVSKAEFEKDPVNIVKIVPGDARMIALVDQKLMDLQAQGAIDEGIKKSLENIINPIVDGQYSPMRVSPIEGKGRVDLIPSKQVISGESTDGKRVYQKMSIFYLTRELTSYWDEETQTYLPLRGREKLHNMYESMVQNKVNFLAPETASKLFFPEGAPSENSFDKGTVKTPISTISNLDRRRQQENDTHKEDITVLTNQVTNILGSEITSPVGKELRQQWLDTLNTIKQRTFDNIKKMFTPEQRVYLIDRIRENIEKSTSDTQAIELLEEFNGDFKYNTNIPHISAKTEEVFFSMFKNAFKTRISGRKLTHAAPDVQVLIHTATKRVVPIEEQRGNYKFYQGPDYSTRHLGMHECLIPKKWADLAGLKPGDKVSEKLFKLIGYRIPSQNYHSISTLTVVDFLPDYYGDTIMCYKEIYALMGSDNDIDALYTFMPAWYRKDDEIIIYGEESTPEDKFVSFYNEIFEKNPSIKAEFFESLYADPNWRALVLGEDRPIDDNIDGVTNTQILAIVSNLANFSLEKRHVREKHIKKILEKYNFPGTFSDWEKSGSPEAISSSENYLIALMQKILSLPELQKALNEPLSTNPEREALAEFKRLLPKVQPKQYLANSINAKLDSYVKQFAAKPLVGVSVQSNSVSQFLTENQINLNPDFSFYLDGKPYSTYNHADLRTKADAGSSVVGAIVDSAKDPVADKFNWSRRTLGPVNILLGLNVPFLSQALFFKQPIISTYVKKANYGASPWSGKKDKFGVLDSVRDEVFDNFEKLKVKIEVANLTPEEKTKLKVYHQSFYNPNALKLDDLKSSLNPENTLIGEIRFLGTQLQVIDQFSVLSQISGYLFNVSKVLSTNRTMGKSISEIYDILEAFSKIRRQFPEPPVQDVNLAIEGNTLLNGNEERLYDITSVLRDFFIKLTPMFQRMRSTLKRAVIKRGDPYLEDKMMTYLSSQILRKNMKFDLVKAAKDILLGDDSLATAVLKAQQDDKVKNNPFIGYVKPMFRATKGNPNPLYEVVTSDSRTRLTPEATDLLINGFQQLLADAKTRDLGQKLYVYLLLKDNLGYSNQSFIKYISPVMFQNLANGLKKFNEGAVQNSQEIIKGLTGKNSIELLEGFAEVYAGYTENQEFILGANADNLSVPDGKNKIEIIKVSGPSNGILTLSLNPEATEQHLRDFSTFEIDQGEVNYPKLIKRSSAQGVPQVYILQESDGRGARYKVIPQFGVKGISPYLYSLEENLRIHQEFTPKLTEISEETIRAAEEALSSDIYSKLGNRTQSENIKIVSNPNDYLDQQTKGQAVVAFRSPGNKHFGNPFGTSKTSKYDLIPTNSVKEAVQGFIDWLTTNKYSNVEPERREWILNQLKAGTLKGKPVYYYKELGEPSHATALDYLINKHFSSQGTLDFPEEPPFSLKKEKLDGEIKVLRETIESELPAEIANAVTILSTVPKDILGRDNLFLSLKDILNDNGINNELLINWLGINNNTLKKHPESFKSEQQITNLITQIYNEKKKVSNHPALKDNKLALESFNKWVHALRNYPVAFQDVMLTHAIKYLNPGRRAKYVLQLSEVALTNAYGIVVNKPHELNRIGKLYDQEVLKTVGDAVGHEPSASGNGYWVHIPRTSSGKQFGYDSYDDFKKDIEEIRNRIEKKSKILDNPPVFKSQEPNLGLEDAIKYGFKGYSYVRVESSYGRGSDPYPKFLGKDYEGYYIHGYNTERGKPETKIVPISKEEAKSLWQKEIDFYPNHPAIGYDVDERQAIYSLPDDKRRLERLEKDFKTIKPEDWGKNAAQHKVNVELLRKLSPSTWCTASGMASSYVENYDNYLLIVNGITVAGVEAYPDEYVPHEAEAQEKIQDLEEEKKSTNNKTRLENIEREIERIKNWKPKKRQVKEVTSRANNGVSSIDHFDDIFAFFEKHNLDTDNASLQRAKKAKEAGQKDADYKHYDEPDGPYNPYGEGYDMDGYPNDPPENDGRDYEPPDQEEAWEAEQQRLINVHEVEQIATVEEALQRIEAGEGFILQYFHALPVPVRNNEVLANKAIDRDAHNIAHISPTNPNYNELVRKALTNNGYVFHYLPQEVKDIPEFREMYDQYMVRQQDDLPFSKTSTALIQGYYDPKTDKVVLIAANTPVNEASEVAIHEVAHRGMLRMAKDLGGYRELFEVLKNAEVQLMRRLPELLKRTGHTSLEDLMLDYGFDKNSEDGHFKLLQELAARWAETLIKKPKPSWWKELLQKIGEWIKKFTGQVLTEEEVNELVGGFVKYGTENVGKEKGIKSGLKLSMKGSASIQDALNNHSQYSTIAMDFDGTIMDTNTGIRDALKVTPKEFYFGSTIWNQEELDSVYDKSPLTDLGRDIIGRIRRGEIPVDKVKVITAGKTRQEKIANLLGIPLENVIIVTDPDVMSTYNLQNDVPLDKALIVSTFEGKTLFIDDKISTVNQVKKLESTDAFRYLGTPEEDIFERIPGKLQKLINDTRQNLVSRKAQLSTQTGFAQRKEVQSRIQTIESTLNRLTAQGTYEILMSTGYSELKSAQEFIKKGDPWSLREASKILHQYKNFDEIVLSDEDLSSELRDTLKAKLAVFRQEIGTQRLLLDKAIWKVLSTQGKRVGLDYKEKDLQKPQKDISWFQEHELTPKDTGIPLSRTIGKVLEFIKLLTNSEVQPILEKGKKIKEGLPENWHDLLFDKNGRFITEVSPEYFDEQKAVMEYLKEANKSNIKADIKRAYQKIFDWHKDNNTYVYPKDLEDAYNEEYANQRDNVFTDENGELDRAGLQQWELRNAPLTGKLDPVTRIMDLTDEDGPKMVNGQYNTGWYNYLIAVPKENWKNPLYENVKDNEAYQFLRELLEESIKKLPHRVSIDKGSFEKFLDQFRLDLTEKGPRIKEIYSGVTDFLKDSVGITLTQADLNAATESILDEKGHRKPHLKSTSIQDIHKEIKDPFDAILEFYKFAVAYDHKNKIEPVMDLLQAKLETLPGYKTNTVGKILKTLLNGGKEHPELLENGLKRAASQSKFQIQARLYGKTRADENKRSFTPQELEEIAEYKESYKEWIKNGALGEPPVEPEFHKMTPAKLADAVVDYTRILKLGGSPLSGINNLLMGYINNYSYAVRKREFGNEDLDWAASKLLNSVMKYWFGVPFSKKKRVITPLAKKIAAGMAKMGIMEEVMEVGETKIPGWLDKAVQALMTFQESGEFLIHGQILLAMLKKEKVKDLTGKERPLWDAFDEEFNWKSSEFGENDSWKSLEVLDTDGKNTSKLLEFQQKLNDVRVRTQSDYQNPLKGKETATGRVGHVFRTWIPQAIHQRFGAQVGDEFKGRYTSYSDIKGQLGEKSLIKLLGLILGGSALKALNIPLGIGKVSGLKKISDMGLDKIDEYLKDQGVTDLDIENFRVNLKEFQMLIYFAGALAGLIAMSGGDDDDTWAYKYFGNVANRIVQDLSFFYYPDSFIGIIKDPIPIMSTITDGMELLGSLPGLLDPKNNRYKKGFRKGQNKTLKELGDITPLYRQYLQTQGLINQIYGTDNYKYSKK